MTNTTMITEYNERTQPTYQKNIATGVEQWFRYDADGNMIYYRDSDGNGFDTEWNAAGDVLSRTYTDGYSVWFTYNADGTPASRADSDGAVRFY